MKEVKRYTDQEIFDCLDIHHMCRGPYVLAFDYDALVKQHETEFNAISAAVSILACEKAALARDRDAYRDALQDMLTEAERYRRSRDRLYDEVRHLRTAQLRALSSIGDLPAGEEG